MCGRFTLKISSRVLDKQFLLEEPTSEMADRFNIAPSQQVLGIQNDEESNKHTAFHARWGLIPFWAKDEKIGYKMINARSETAATKPAFRAAVKQRRCILPASGFYEWKRDEKQKQPYYIYPKKGNAQYLAMAGLWETWRSPSGEVLTSATVLTTSANAFMAEIHDRMPVFLSPETYSTWLDTSKPLDEETYQALVKPAPDDWLACHPVSTRVNSPRNEDATLIAIEERPPPFSPKTDGEKTTPTQQDLF